MADEVTKTEDAPAPIQTSLADNPEVVSKVQSALDAFNESESVVAEAEVEAPAEEPAVKSDAPVEPAQPVAKTEEPTGESDETPPEKTEEAAAEPAKAEDAPTLPAAYVRSAKARGWTDDEITDFAKANPDTALKTFERIHTSRVQEVEQWAALGRRVKETAQPPAPAAAPATTPVQAAPALKTLDVAAMVEKYGNEDLIKEITAPINATIQALTPLIQGAVSAQEQAKRQQQEQLGQTVQAFFTGADMKPYAEAYGTNLQVLTPAQVEMRAKVLETADALMAGAVYQGRNLSVQEALVLAHDSVASGIKEQIIRNEVRQTVKKRNAALTLKPTATGRPAAGGAPRDRQELLSRTEDRLAAAFA